MSRNVSLRHVRCFVEIAHSGSFTAAAARLYMTQSSLTHVIQQFEEAIGIQLFDRSTRRVTLTDAALHYLPEAEQLVKRFDASIADLSAFSSLKKGHIRFAAAASVIELYLNRVIERFHREYPQMTVSVRDSGAQHLERMVLEGAIDFAVAERHQQIEDLRYTPLMADRYGVVFRNDDALASSTGPVDWRSLELDRYLGFTTDTGVDSFLRRHTDQFVAEDGGRNEVSSSTSLFSLLQTPGRYSIVPALTAHHGRVYGLSFRPLAAPELKREICLISRNLRSLSPGAEAFLAIFQATLLDTKPPEHVELIAEADCLSTGTRESARAK
ncbi:LysR family transcriptional regulator [Paraburkholderia tropica]|uniref:LysR family transcriptional regulator n=1 Tax=Paraburkholderia tropica TaxID=92647 RepID=UPI002AB73AA6|nr:LysR family transcriptional regulator [Paraburkholderia tropica]